MAPPSVPAPDLAACAARRARVAEHLDGAALLLASGEQQTRSNDTHFRFRPDSNFYYLTGLAESGCTLVLRPGRQPRCVLFMPVQDERDVLYHGRRAGADEVRAAYGVDAVLPARELPVELPRLLDGVDDLYLPFSTCPATERAAFAAIERLRAGDRRGEVAPTCIHDARALLAEDRIVKDASGLAALRRAVDISAAGHVAAMRAVRPGQLELEIEALLEHEFRRRGASGPGYETIVAAGAHANTLHYTAARGSLRAGELLLVDAGAEWELFTGDITRTFPISGGFSPAQRQAYAIVLAANEAGIAAATTGSSLDAIHDTCLRVLCEGLRELGLVSGGLEAIVEGEQYKPYYPHKTSHWLGADVHDVGRYTIGGRARALRPGYVLTVEPGLYFPADDPRVPAELRGVGIRVEDDVLVTDGAPEVLSAAAPKQVAELEAICGKG